MAVTSGANMREITIMLKISREPGKRCLAMAKAQSDAKSTWPAVPRQVMIKVFKRYLEMGTHDSAMRMARSLKLSRVGLRTKNLGGKRNSSFRGLKALLTT